MSGLNGEQRQNPSKERLDQLEAYLIAWEKAKQATIENWLQLVAMDVLAEAGQAESPVMKISGWVTRKPAQKAVPASEVRNWQSN